ncbi:ATP-dependent RNA helicase [Pedobacter yulinensis]|uniref:ATP-dependent RNA helicase n=2 Tax=Pedobacter yulinensis TaxID=2126353 RepID=A0A2T3HSB7_9SPHI|nr:ATP-dependent RNA helicase [Pedobacter yulinensis]
MAMGYKSATPIQEQAIPIVQQGADLVACAQTGTGKTASYLLPIMDAVSKEADRHNNTLILSPTRELAQQIDIQVEALAYFTNISSLTVYGGGDGVAYDQQKRSMREGVDIIIATPGRLISHLASGTLNLSKCKHLVLDEADRMLDMGFYDDIMRIVGYLPKDRQTLLFSATMPPKIRKLASGILRDPQQVNIAISKPAEGILQQAYKVQDHQKVKLLSGLLKKGDFKSIIIFASTKEKVKTLNKSLRAQGMKVEAFHSDLDQKEREALLLEFKNRKLSMLIGTDVLSRGIDVTGIDLVVNFDVPHDPEDYVHRIGRTARAATTGTAITLVNTRDKRKFTNIEKLIEREIDIVPLPEEIEKLTAEEAPAQEQRNNRDRKGGRGRDNRPGRQPGARPPRPQQAEKPAAVANESAPVAATGAETETGAATEAAKPKAKKKKFWRRKNGPKTGDGAAAGAATETP